MVYIVFFFATTNYLGPLLCDSEMTLEVMFLNRVANTCEKKESH